MCLFYIFLVLTFYFKLRSMCKILHMECWPTFRTERVCIFFDDQFEHLGRKWSLVELKHWMDNCFPSRTSKNKSPPEVSIKNTLKKTEEQPDLVTLPETENETFFELLNQMNQLKLLKIKTMEWYSTNTGISWMAASKNFPSSWFITNHKKQFLQLYSFTILFFSIYSELYTMFLWMP